MEITIRKAEAEDAEAIGAILRDTGWFPSMKDETPETTAERIARHLGFCRADDSHSVYVAQGDEGIILGYASVHWLPYLFLKGPEGYLSELFVNEAYRGHGAGSLLLASVTEEGRSRGCVRLNLVNNYQRESYRRGFYARRGWVEREEMSNFVYLYSSNHDEGPFPGRVGARKAHR